MLVLIIAVVMSGQVLTLMERGRSVRKRLRDLSWGGDASSMLLVGALLCGALGMLLGSLWDRAAVGSVAGLVVALLSWVAAVVWAHQEKPQSPRHRQPEQ
ncbi:hypothetical protein [Kribbella swartbergensis]